MFSCCFYTQKNNRLSSPSPSAPIFFLNPNYGALRSAAKSQGFPNFQRAQRDIVLRNQMPFFRVWGGRAHTYKKTFCGFSDPPGSFSMMLHSLPRAGIQCGLGGCRIAPSLSLRLKPFKCVPHGQTE